MKKFIFTLIVIFIHQFSIAQNRFWIINDTRLYEKPSIESNYFGFFRYGAEVKIIEDLKNGWLKVQSDNFTIGFVKKVLVRTSMNGNDVINDDALNPIIKGSDGYHGNNHLFVTVAGLKARSQPNKTANIRQILTNGEAVSINYAPINAEEWVNIGTHFDPKYAQFVQLKYLGKRPIYEDLISKFDKIDKSNIAERKTIAERLVELSWNSENEKILPALNRYYEVAKQLNDEKLIKETEFNILIAKEILTEKDFGEIDNLIQKSNFKINGIVSDGTILTYSELIKNFGKPTKIENVEDECGVYLTNILYHYQAFIISVDKENNQAEIVEVFFNETTQFILNPKEIIDQKLSETDFIIKYGKYLDFDYKNPHFYSFPIDAGRFTIYFKDGKLFSLEIMYYC